MKRKQLLSALILSAMLLASCGGGETASTADNTEAVATTEAVTETEYVTANVPDTDFNGKTFTIYGRIYEGAWNAMDIYAHEETGEQINDAVYARTIHIEDKYNMKFAAIEAGASTMASNMKTYITSGDDSFQAIVSDVYDAGSVAMEGMLYDLNDVKNIDLTQRWWAKTANDTMTIAKAQYYATGEMFIVDNRAVRVFFFNKDIISDLKLDNPYTLVSENKWTFDTYFALSEAGTQDVNGDGVLKRGDDIFGTLAQPTLGEALLIGSGESMTKKDKDDIPYIACTTEKAMTVMVNIAERITKAKSVSMDNSSTITSGAYPDNLHYFMNGQALFAPEVLKHIETMRDCDVDIGIVPPPKYNSTQEGYYCYADGWCVNVVSIPSTNTAPAEIGLILEATSADSLNNLTPAYYEVCLTSKYVRDKESVAMLDLIFANVVMDNANIFSWGGLESKLNSAFASGDIASAVQSVKDATEAAIEKTVTAFKNTGK